MQISVIIPSYQPKAYIYDCIDSLRKQTLAHTEWEAVIVLNGPVEPYQKQIQTYLDLYPQEPIRLLLSPERGVSRARNLGIEMTCGQYLVFIDDDDWVSPTYLEQLLHSVSDAPQSCISVCQATDYNEDTQQDERLHFLGQAWQAYQPTGHEAQTTKPQQLLHVRHFFSSACSKIIPRKVIGNARFQTKYTQGEDALFMAELSCRVHHISKCPPDAIYHVRCRNQSAMRSFQSYRQRIPLLFRLSLSYAAIWLKHPLAYQPLFMLSRIYATLRKLTWRVYH